MTARQPSNRVTQDSHTLKRIVNRKLVTIPESASVTTAVQMINQKFLSALAATDNAGHLTGVVSLRDLVGKPPSATVKSVMTPMVFSVDIGVSVKTTARLMADSKLHRIFVEEGKQIVGLVTLTDIVRFVGEVGLGSGSTQDDNHLQLSDIIKVDKPRDLFIASLERCGEALGGVFYRRFMASSELVQARFARTDMKSQEKKITKTLRLAADVVMGEPKALAELTQQAELHNRSHLNIAPELYGLWLEALIGAVSECDPQYNRAVEHAWRLLMGHIIRHMTQRY